MRNLLYIILLGITLSGCIEKPKSVSINAKNLDVSEDRIHRYHTYYGDIDVDTMTIEGYIDSLYPYYKVKVLDKDSFILKGDMKYIDGPIEYFYCPAKDRYYATFPDKYGNIVFAPHDTTFNYDLI